ncbi:MAG: DUF2341 domain-containing protein, partial [Planctomycetota bacterium]
SNVQNATATSDIFAPAAIGDLAASQGTNTGEIDLTWTASGDDGTVGTASAYVVKYSTSAIDAGNFDSATTYVQSWTPQASGNLENHTLTGLLAGELYYIAIKVADEIPNTSLISNVVSAVPFYGNWWNTSWSRRRPIIINGSTAGILTDFQIRVPLTFDSDMRADFGDIRFTELRASVETEISHWLEVYTASTSAVFWVKVPNIPAPPEQRTIYVYYGNAGATTASNFDTTFTKNLSTTGLVGYWPMDGGSGTSVSDSSGNSNTGTMNNFSAPDGWVGSDGGQWGTRSDVQFSTGDSLSFDGADDTVDCGNGAVLSLTTAMTLEAWVKGDQKTVNGNAQLIVSKWEVQSTGFSNTGSWSAYDPGSNGVGTDPDGFCGAVFDGRYIYFVAENTGSTYTGEVMRYDTRASFTSTSSWSTFDAGANGVGSDPDGYWGGVFDGRYIYFVPYYNGSSRHGEVLRYDTQGAFTTVSSWATYDPGTNGVGGDADGYFGGVFDGRYVYFVPYHNGIDIHGLVLRYDTQGSFTAISSWASYEARAQGLGNDPEGYIGAVYDGRYIYFAPHYNNPVYHGEVMRYDTQAAFTSISSWAAYDAGANGVGTNPDGFDGAVFDGRYVYFVPNYHGSAHGEVLRYDTKAAFTSVSSWSAYDAGSNGVGVDPDGFIGAVFDGHYIYFVPRSNGSTASGEVLRYDTRGTFAATSSWTTFDAGSNGVGVAPYGFTGGVCDGRYIYFAPYQNASNYHGEVLRYDTSGNAGSYKLAYSQQGQDGALSSAPFGISGIINTGAGAFSVHTNSDLAAGSWRHVALTYDGTTLSLYVNASLVDSCPATGSIFTTTAPVRIGSFHQGASFIDGSLDEIRVYNRALPIGEILTHFERRKYADPEPVVNAPGPEETYP